MRVPRLLAILVTILLAVAACGGDDDGNGEASGEGQAQGASSNEPVELEFWNQDYTEWAAPYDEIDKLFTEQHPNVTIKQVAVPSAEAPEKLRAAVAARQGPDLISMYPGSFAQTFSDGLLPLQDRLTDQQREDLLLLDTSLSPDGNLYVLPWNPYGYVMSYNKLLFEQAGLDPEAPPDTWDGFLDACRQLRAAGIEPVAAGFSDGIMLEWFIYVFGDAMLDPEKAKQWSLGQLPANDPGFVRAVEYTLEMQDAECFQSDAGAEGRTVDDTATEFQNGNAAMVLFYGPSGIFPQFEEGLGKENVGAFLTPPFPDGAYDHAIMDLGPGHGYGITNFSEHPEEAWAYLSFLMSQEAQQIYFDSGAGLPVNRTVDVSSPDEPLTDQMLSFLSIKENYTTYLGFSQPLLDVIHAESHAVFDRSMTPQEMMDDVQEKKEELG